MSDEDDDDVEIAEDETEDADLETRAGEEEGEEEELKGEEEEEEKEEPLLPMPLTEEIMKEGLSLLCKTGNGLAHAYVKLEAKDRELTDISILSTYIHLRYVNISQNYLQDLSPLNSLTHLLWLKADQNRLVNAYMEDLPYLQIASFSLNRINDPGGIGHPRLESLNLSGNEIATVSGMEFRKLENLHTLELRANKLQSTAGILLPNLRNLYLAQNSITKLEGLEGLIQLRTLHLRDNQLESLDGFSESMKSLQYLNIRGNKIESLVEMQKLSCLKSLRALALLDNACVDLENYRIEVLIAVPQLERLDKDFFQPEDRAIADEIRSARLVEIAEEGTEDSRDWNDSLAE
ncbi:leucine-rich repeat-containing protein 23 [Rhinatrema bivittatum]|uniref:leucine-rich repeat-containing protein 23 n=1 Tax=Rhinatrema bivittatum TaxID=194408 RepID=UPI0011271B16|nr:leucine-rich repeat-containing protein 23 [Rhinatrema bivittatum]XP_029437571.1 leucine-rich repeat-containing protein 23 [Rhinatrema bivittatum]XP_029437573.1 leucine-rich repeat-containing protein 23 [Rhinatrema bivittatum]XP_029437574.1 leucine-rich repeat-containing protein 23 [Rhinatrema bivittatum]XP_029437575.1 leucine-rich repeat-containing protein 23 [Rhinatrema bivittatum]